ncbi:MAG: glycosyltransferase family 2 protein [Methanoregula sp.]
MYQKVCIILLNWNGLKDTIECLESIFQIDYQNYNIIVVDNNSTDDSVAKIKNFILDISDKKNLLQTTNEETDKFVIFEYFSRKTDKILQFFPNPSKSFPVTKTDVVLIKNESNDGFAIGNNIGIEFALQYLNPDYFLLLNNDTVVDKQFLTKLLDNVTADEKIGLASPLIFEYYNKNKLQYSCDKIQWFSGRILPRVDSNYHNICESDTICGASMLIKKEVVRKIGYLPAEYFMLWEDIDYSVNAKRNGFKLVYVRTSKIWHKGSASIGKMTSPLRIKYSIRNRFIFWRKYATPIKYISFMFVTLFIHIPVFILFNILKTKEKVYYLKHLFSGLKEGLTHSLKE